MKNTLIVLAVLIVVGAIAYFIVSDHHASTVPEATTSTAADTSSDAGMPGMDMPMQPADSSSTTTTTTVTTPAVSVSSTSTSSASVAIQIKNYAFSPATVTIAPGTKVTWTNDDSVAHTVTSDSDGVLNSPSIAPGQSYSYTFTADGTTAYHCAVHPSMKATIIVRG